MSYGTIKVDTITFTDGGVDKSISVSGLTQNPTITGNLTVTGTISGDIIEAGTSVSGVTVLGTSGTFTTLTGATTEGTTATFTSGSFTTLTGTTTSGTTANFVSGVFSTSVSGATVQGTAGDFTTITGGVTTITSGVFALGTNALPSISFSSDPNTGIYSPGADQVAISTNGTGRLFVDASGNVGVGAASPSTLLTLAGSNDGSTNNNTLRFVDTDSSSSGTQESGRIEFFTSDSTQSGVHSYIAGQTTDVSGNGAITFGTGLAGSATERLRITSDGKLGLGTSVPGYPLTVLANGASNTNNIIAHLFNYNAYPTRGLFVYNGRHAASGRDNAQVTFDVQSGASNGTMLFQTDGNTALTIDGSQRVGIGTTDPAELLHLQSGSNTTLRIDNTGGTARQGRITVTSAGDMEFRARSNTSDGQFIFYGYGGTTDSEHARIDSSGRLLVGTSTADSNFYITANAYAPSVQIKNTNQVGLSVTRSDGAANISIATSEVVIDDDTVGRLIFNANDGSKLLNTAEIKAEVDGTPSADVMPGRLVFSTTADGDNSPTERMTIKADGKVGIGATEPDELLHISSATGGPTPTPTSLRIETTTSSASWSTTDPWGEINFYSTDPSGGGPKKHAVIDVTSEDANGSRSTLGIKLSGATSSTSTRLSISSAGTTTLTSASNTAPFIVNVSTTEAARIDGSGRLLVGTTTSASSWSATTLEVIGNTTNSGNLVIGRNDTSIIAGNGIGRVSFWGNDSSGTTYEECARIEAEADGTHGDGDKPTRLVFSTTADGDNSPTERMTIGSDGRVRFGGIGVSNGATTSDILVGTSASTTGGVGIESNTFGVNTTRYHYSFANGNGVVGSISTSGSATAFNTSSDYRLKENVVPLTGAVDRLNQLQVHRFNFIADPDTTVDGFIAHEAQAVVPECVTGTKDEVDDEGNPVYQGIDQSKLVPLLTAALQEALAKIEVLEQRLTDAGIA